MWNVGLNEAQAWIKIAVRNVNNLRYADDTTLIAESKEELKSLFGMSSLSAIRVVLSAYLRVLICLPAILIQACASFSLTFLMMYSAYKLNKHMTIYSLDTLLSWFGTSLLFHVQF